MIALILSDPRHLIATLLVLGLVIWVLFYVLPLPPVWRNVLAVVVAILLILAFLPGCAVEFRADGTRKVSFNPTAEDYKAIRNFSR